MELRTLHYFTTVAEELNITRAAERLNMSQPPLSKQIINLEEELGVRLFTRGKRHLSLTDAGIVFYRRAKQILDLCEMSKEEISSLEGLSGTIHVSLVEGRAPFLLSRWVYGFRQEYPNVKFELWNGSGDDALDRLYHGLADISLIASPYDTEHLRGFAVGREPWVAIMSKDHPLAKTDGDFISLKDLANEPLLLPARKSRTEAVRNWFKEVDAEPEIVCVLSNYLDAVALAEQNAGIAIFPQTTYTVNELIVKKIITESARQIEYDIVWVKDRDLTPLIEEFIEFIKDSREDEKQHRQKYLLPHWEYLPPEDTKFL
ncbi:MAG: LysR family transcriptional regulator [Oscillospiraceae bacterium]|nr:LysR family transcriptional regulator [Oscillospiraceae bacterium]